MDVIRANPARKSGGCRPSPPTALAGGIRLSSISPLQVRFEEVQRLIEIA